MHFNHAHILLPEKISDFDASSVVDDIAVNGKMSINRPHFITVALKKVTDIRTSSHLTGLHLFNAEVSRKLHSSCNCRRFLVQVTDPVVSIISHTGKSGHLIKRLLISVGKL